MGIDFEVIWAVEFDNAIRFYVRRPTRRPKSHQSSKKMTDISFVKCIDFGVIWAADFDDDIRFYVHHPARRPWVTRRHTKIQRKLQIYCYGYRFRVIRVTEFDNDIRYYVRRPARQQRANRRHIKILK